ncbi:hypothetical protein EN871_11645 [bacterium M00.F.Ca.ET.228.01.1.1]|uniref:hypothetical protein n=1 Tax=Paraburkholderia phenoliruptrix TaxID=252970 RepID=UPI001092AB43|nr:hypothetical protein [Paraburkholderia phenoliruptrix]TGP43696.1 hypothetical protein EN871_11645 [bacterium M00.F.Ca.ET.228.01.1.1]TGS01358.1 hypothetical protein EN834_11640 [bacterium M00.F.Ca.ET.191.01.1.1]TGU09036.1 hypothetical protein EN798_07890 [bacterium M00.F.Ca.ET.155.01.1.1]MBW0449429.1 hypothetical protein [Paraburkholderia phenoliruptrix]MBW9097710.1 hypothetical protein [Paraburkholderia phenoliruptrix]
MDTVTHITHVENAVRIIETGAIRAKPITGESVLKDGKSRVVWFSPNSWSAGSIYGHVSFELDFASLLANHKCYFVENPAFETKTYRYLITDRKYKRLSLYSASNDTPWWKDSVSGKYLFREGCTIQFAVDMDIHVNKHVQIAFVDHNSDHCILRGNCANRERPAQHGGAHFFMRAVARALDLSETKSLLMTDGAFTSPVQGAVDHLRSSVVQRASCLGRVRSTDQLARPLVRAIFNAFANGLDEEGLAIAALFRSQDSLRSALNKTLADCLGIENLDDARFDYDE